MENEDLKQVFRNLHLRITKDVNPGNAIDVLFSKKIISEADYYDLRQVRGSSSRCRDFLAFLYRSSHPRAFIELRLALLDDYPQIVDEIDHQRTPLNVQQQQQPRQEQPADGQSLLSVPRQQIPASNNVVSSGRISVGLRVVRGDDWHWQDQDGGEGYVGTVVEISGQGSNRDPDNTVVVVWDNGARGSYCAGYEGKHDLRILDNAPTGVRHMNIVCDSCDMNGLRGIRWKCTVCDNFDLCNDCYMSNKHDVHAFLRYDSSVSIGVKVPDRSSSRRIQAKGIYLGARVMRGPDWNYGQQDGGSGRQGSVMSVGDDPSGSSYRSFVKIKWDAGQVNDYRRGHEGSLDVKCVRPTEGEKYYIAHLPKLATRVVKISTDTEVYGVTSVDDELIVLLCRHDNQVAVYSINDYQLLRHLNVPQFTPREITSCVRRYFMSPETSPNDPMSYVRRKCLYMSDFYNNRIRRYDFVGSTFSQVSQWSVPGQPFGLSVTPSCNLLVTCREPNKLVELSADSGQCVREIALQSNIVSPEHGVLTTGHFVVCHGVRDNNLHRVCVVGDDGKVTLSYGDQPGYDVGQLNCPRRVAVDKDSQFIFVADRDNRRVVLLSPTLEFVRCVSKGLSGPRRLYLHQATQRLFAGRGGDVTVIQL